MRNIQTDTGSADPPPRGNPHFGLTPELEALRVEAREFARRLRPRAAENEWLPIRERIDWEMVEEASTRGWRTIGLPRKDGGGGASALALNVLIEELAAGDMGFVHSDGAQDSHRLCIGRILAGG